MNTLRLEADDAHEKNEELKAKLKTLEQENLSKEQEITSLNHRNQLLEEENEKLEASLKDAKDAANSSAQHDTQNEALQRRVQLLEQEAEDNEKALRETNEKYESPVFLVTHDPLTDRCSGSAKPMSRATTTSARCRHLSQTATHGNPSTRRWPRSTPSSRRTSTTSRFPSAMFKHCENNVRAGDQETLGGCRLPLFQLSAFML